MSLTAHKNLRPEWPQSFKSLEEGFHLAPWEAFGLVCNAKIRGFLRRITCSIQMRFLEKRGVSPDPCFNDSIHGEGQISSFANSIDIACAPIPFWVYAARLGIVMQHGYQILLHLNKRSGSHSYIINDSNQAAWVDLEYVSACEMQLVA